MDNLRIKPRLALLGVTLLSLWTCISLATFARQLGYSNFYKFLVLKLQYISVQLSVFLMRGFALKASSDGYHITAGFRAHTVQIAPECSGISSLTALVVIAGIIALYSCKARWIGKVQVYLAFVPIAILGNALRIFSVTTLGACGVSETVAGFVHDTFGWVFYALDIIILLGVSKLAELAYPNPTE